jgi:Leucine rich repeat
MPRLQHLDISENEVADVKGGLQGMSELRKLVLTKNKITSLEGIATMPRLEHLILIENQIATAKDLVHLNKAVPNLKQLDMMENPASADGLKTEVLIIQSDSNIVLKKLNEEEITDEDRQAAATTKAERIKAEEEARKEAEAKAAAGNGDGAIAEAADE